MPVLANDFEDDEDTGDESHEFGGVVGEKMTEYYSDSDNKPSYGERFAAGMIISFVNGAFHIFGMQDVNTLVFNKKIETHNDFLVEADATKGKVYGTFPLGLFNAITLIYQVFEKLLPIPLVLAVALLGLYLIAFGGSQDSRSKVKDYLMAIVVAILSMRFGFYIFQGVFTLNTYFVDLIWYQMDSISGVKLGAFLDTIWGNGHNNYKQFMSVQSLGIAIIMFFVMIMTAILNYQYMLRLIMLSVLIISFPVANMLSVFPRFRHSLTTWWQEFIAATFMQTAHAIALGLFFLMLHYMGQGGLGFWLVFAYFFGLPTVVAYFRRLIGLGEGNTFMSTIGAMAGVAAIMSASRIFRGKDQKKEGEDRGRERDRNTSGGSRDSSRGANPPPLMNRQSLPNRVLGNKWVRRGAMTAGATMGAVMSTMATGNPVVGLVGGAGVGSLTSNAMARTGRAYEETKQFVADVKQEMQEQKDSSPTQHLPLLPRSPIQASLEKGTQVAQTFGNVMQQRYVSGQGGAVTNAAVGSAYALSSGANKVKGLTKTGANKVARLATKFDNYVVGKGLTTNIQPLPASQPHPRSTFVEQQNQTYDTAMQNMQTIEPELNLAKTHFDEMQSKYGQGSMWHQQMVEQYNVKDNPQVMRPLLPEEYKTAEKRYHKLNEDYNHNKRVSVLAKMNLTDHKRMKEAMQPLQQKGNFTQGRGRL